MASADITLPGIGPVKKQTALLMGGGVVLLGGIVYYRSRHAGAAAAPAAADDSAADSTDLDPATGYPYGSADDTAALNSYDYGYGVSGGSGAAVSTSGGYTTNAQWSQAAEEYLTGTVGQDPDAVGNALGKYITGGAVTSDQVAVIQQAIAFAGYPPVAGQNGTPPSYLTTAAAPSTTAPSTPTGLAARSSTSTNSIPLKWNASTNATGYNISVNGVQRLSVGTTTATLSGLTAGTTYTVGVEAYGPGGYSATTTAKIATAQAALRKLATT